ncbi:acetoacetate decarboxylase [Aspergillus bertholletiae]|uniref:Acetoacetate decarboxylase n=1 Tax=Aspergillus bertholletiae TaxID=1226010 RepID=A0A5N7BHR6_9EURO|nr:acetoacetate decarboxylase [Aspergillus bertholletiae]
MVTNKHWLLYNLFSTLNMPFGSLSVSNTAIPQYAPPYPVDGSDYTSDNVLIVNYQTTAHCVRHLVPDMLELEDEPHVSVMILQHSMTSFGPYNEYVHSVKVKYNGDTFDYFLSLILDNDSPILCGREQFGFPKKLGAVTLVPTTRSTVVHGYVERPAGQKVIEVGFQPEHKVEGRIDKTIPGLNLRVIPSVVPGQSPSVKELVPVDIRMEANEVWQGSGSICFPEPSKFDPMHQVKVLRYGIATLLRNASLTIRLPTKVFQL